MQDIVLNIENELNEILKKDTKINKENYKIDISNNKNNNFKILNNNDNK